MKKAAAWQRLIQKQSQTKKSARAAFCTLRISFILDFLYKKEGVWLKSFKGVTGRLMEKKSHGSFTIEARPLGARPPGEGDKNTGPSRRQRQVAEEVRVGLARLLASFPLVQKNTAGDKDTALLKTEISITVSEVQMSRDLRHARVYCLPLGQETVPADVLADLLNAEAPFLQNELKRQCTLKFLPRLRFLVDTSFDKADTIHKTLYHLHDVTKT